MHFLKPRSWSCLLCGGVSPPTAIRCLDCGAHLHSTLARATEQGRTRAPESGTVPRWNETKARPARSASAQFRRAEIGGHAGPPTADTIGDSLARPAAPVASGHDVAAAEA